MDIRKKISQYLLSLAKRVDMGTVESYTTYITSDPYPVIKYDIDRFEFIRVRLEESLRWLESIKSMGGDYHIEIEQLLAEAIGKEILKRHRGDVREYQIYNGNKLTDKVAFTLKLLVEKPNNKEE